jgi:FixJ family two-component response regulator
VALRVNEQPASGAKQPFAPLAGLSRWENQLMPASLPWAKFNVVRGNVPRPERRTVNLLVNQRSQGGASLPRMPGLGGSSVGTPFVREGALVTHGRPPKQIDALLETPVVLVVDDGPSLREALSRLFRSVDLESRSFPSVAELLMQKFPDVPCCLLLDIRLPGVSGLDLQTQLANSNIHVPIIMMTGHGDIPMSVRGMKGGAVDFLTKPFRDQDMLDAVAQAIERDRKRWDSDKALAELRRFFESLTPREREIMALVTAGLMNKQVAGELGLSEITVKIHRGHIMRKMGVRSLADLVRAGEALELH